LGKVKDKNVVVPFFSGHGVCQFRCLKYPRIAGIPSSYTGNWGRGTRQWRQISDRK